ncbi:TrsH/TraH family protein [Macrococcus armenti]|uniref:TrsH/TraH family protein n=1 Tax=Macrococcus armenti TaxID=2875764 RepID=UPI001CCFB592|nr:TrsH/TraH family protein [Macrococcus armenti]UBH09802.1 hypothetical protein LAU41_11795 [Macrococcus armenti]
MKKALLLMLVTVILSGCSLFNNEKLQEQKEKNNISNNQKTEKFDNQDRNKLIKDFIEKGYLYESYNSFSEKDKKKILSEKMIAETNLPVEIKESNKDIKREIRDVHLYQETDDKKMLVYDVKVKLLNSKTNKSEYTRRYGTLQMIEDDKGNLKIDSIQENYTEHLVNFNQ